MDTSQICQASKVEFSEKEELQFILLDKKVYGYAKNENLAKGMIEELANQMEKETLEAHGGESRCKVFRTTNDNIVTISYQTLGRFYNSSVKEAHTIEYTLVKKLILRH